MFTLAFLILKLGWFLDIDTEIGEPVVNDDGTRTYDVTATYSNVLNNADKVNAGNYILGSYGGTITGYIHIFAPAGGTISDIKLAMVEECIQVLTTTLMLHICLATQLFYMEHYNYSQSNNRCWCNNSSWS